MIRAYIGLGGNLDNPKQQLLDAFVELAQIPASVLVAQSSLYSSAPVGPPGQPDYINACAALDTELEPHQLLDALQSIENAHQRVRIEHWGPRTLDLDLLLYGDQVIDSARLKVPHPYLCERNFVLYPLLEIAASAQLPSGISIAEVIKTCPATGLQRLTSN